MKPARAVRVQAAYAAVYPDPISLKKGERLALVGKEDPEYPGWVWCEAENGKKAWTPKNQMEKRGAFFYALEA